jgi:ferrous iron transport protein B
VFRHTWEKGKQYLHKMGTTILAASIIVWALSYFPHNPDITNKESQMEQSYMGKIGKVIEPVLSPCGLSWKEGISITAGVGAKEIVASTMGVLYSSSNESAELDDEDAEQARLSRVIRHSGMSDLSALSFLVFVLLYFPCIPTCIAIKNESGQWKWALFTMFYTTCTAWCMSTLVYQIGSLFI